MKKGSFTLSGKVLPCCFATLFSKDVLKQKFAYYLFLFRHGLHGFHGKGIKKIREFRVIRA